MEQLLAILFIAIITDNVILMKFLGLCPFFGVSKDLKAALSMGLAVTFVMTIASLVTWTIYHFILSPFEIIFLKTVVFILVVATLVQFVEMAFARISPVLQRVLGIYLPLITTNCAVLGICLLNVKKDLNLIETLVHSIGAGIGFLIAICLMAGIRERLALTHIPPSMRGLPISFLVGCFLALSFFGFQGFKVN